MKIFIAGSNTKNVSELCRWYDLPKLYSFLNEKRLIELWDDRYLLMVDSGAHTWNKETITKVGMTKKKKLQSAETFIRTYFEFIKEHREKKVIWVEFDVYGHLPIEWIDLLYKRVTTLEGFHGKFLRVYHPILDNGNLDMLKKWIDEGNDYIGVGNDSTPYLDKIFYLTRDKVKIHGFAMTKVELLEQYPFFSADSTSPIATIIFGSYSKPILSKKIRQCVYDDRSIECYHEDRERLKNAIVEVAWTQEYLTNLWKAKANLTWTDLNF